MNNTPSLNEINKNSSMNPNMLTKYYKLKIMNDFMNIKYQNSKNDTIRDIISIKHVLFNYTKIKK